VTGGGDGDGEPALGTLFPAIIVVRGGRSKPEDLASSAWICYEKTGIWGLTFWGWPDMKAEDIAPRVKEDAEQANRANPLPHSVIRYALNLDLPDIGGSTELYPSGPAGHYTFKLPFPPAEDDWSGGHVLRTWGEWWDAISSSLSEPIENPAKKIQRGGWQ